MMMVDNNNEKKKDGGQTNQLFLILKPHFQLISFI